jgi:hypothetical protein
MNEAFPPPPPVSQLGAFFQFSLNRFYRDNIKNVALLATENDEIYRFPHRLIGKRAVQVVDIFCLNSFNRDNDITLSHSGTRRWPICIDSDHLDTVIILQIMPPCQPTKKLSLLS